MTHMVLDATGAGAGWSGDDVLLRGLVDGVLLAATERDTVTVIRRPGVDVVSRAAPGSRADIRQVEVAAARGARRLAATVPRAVRRLQPPADVLAAHVHAPIGLPCPTVLTITDLSFLTHPEAFSPAVGLRLRTVVPRQARRVAGVMVMTEALRGQAVDLLGIDEARVHVVPMPMVHEQPDAGIQQRRRQWARERGVARRYLLAVGSGADAGDRARLVFAFLEAQRDDPRVASCQLVLVGPGALDEAAQNAVAAGPAGAVVALGPVASDQRSWLIHDAHALIYPALFEGLGLPVLEAMASRVPVLVSATSAIAATVAGAAEVVDATAWRHLAAQIRRVLVDEDHRAGLVRGGVDHVASLTVERTGVAAIAVLRRAAGVVGTSAQRREVVR